VLRIDVAFVLGHSRLQDLKDGSLNHTVFYRSNSNWARVFARCLSLFFVLQNAFNTVKGEAIFPQLRDNALKVSLMGVLKFGCTALNFRVLGFESTTFNVSPR
jgi:hypothetical protein